MVTRTALHELVDAMPDNALDAAEAALLRLRDDPVLRAIVGAPVDDELLRDDERAMLDERRASAEAGNLVSHEQVRELLNP